MPTKQDEDLLDALKRVAAILRDGGVPFVLGGGMAAWARGGPSTEHDIDLVISPDDVGRALQLLADEGLRTERPPEGWLVKAWVDDVLVDLIHTPTGIAVDEAFFERSETLNVHAVEMKVMTMVDVLTTKLGALTEHHLDYGPTLEYARSLREQIDWETLARRTGDSPFARAFLYLVSELGIHPVPEPEMAGDRG